jgi:hypothetical protein
VGEQAERVSLALPLFPFAFCLYCRGGLPPFVAGCVLMIKCRFNSTARLNGEYTIFDVVGVEAGDAFATSAKNFSILTSRYFFVSSKSITSTPRQLSRAEQEVQTASERLTSQMSDALAAVRLQSPDAVDELEACADRLERAARDMAVALRELAEERGNREQQ